MTLASLYEDHFGLARQPFSLTPNTRFYLNVESHHRALQTLLLALDSLEGFIKIVGEVGTGKTLLCRKLMATLDERYKTALVLNPMLAPGDFYRAFAVELGLKVPGELRDHDVLRLINQKLIVSARNGYRVLLIVDEAQTMPPETLEALRLLTNLETESRKLMQVVLFGQPELDVVLARPELRQLRQRITFEEHLQPLDCDAVAKYVQHRAGVAGYRGERLFDRAATRMIFKASGGVPRLINVLSHKALLAAFGRGDARVNKHHVRLATADSPGTGRQAAIAGWVMRMAS